MNNDAMQTPEAATTNRLDRSEFIARLIRIVGARRVLTSHAATRPYCTGFRFGQGKALAVVIPGSLVEQWKVLAACLDANVVVIPQASNTGLTGGSTPDGDYDRDVVIINTTRMKKLYVIEGGDQVVCLPGATLDQLERTLAPLGREPHSVIGSSCIGASVVGGVCNNSGGALLNRGPAYTELAVYAQVDETRALRLINHLGIDLGTDPEDILERLDRGRFTPPDIKHGAGAASDPHYSRQIRDVDSDTPARFNADPRRLFEASGSAGKVMVFAVRLDTFPIESGAKVFYIGTNDTQKLTGIRRQILTQLSELPIAGEYMHRDAFAMAEKYGKDMFLVIEALGTKRLPLFFRMKNRLDGWCRALGVIPAFFTDRVLQFLGSLLPNHLPQRIKDFHAQYEHHLLLKVTNGTADDIQDFLRSYFAAGGGSYFECTADEGRKAFLHRFVTAGAAIRYRAVHASEVEDIVALDIALKRSETDWFEKLPTSFDESISHKLYYGHFFCHVFHQDYIVRKGFDCLDIEHQMWMLLDRRGAEYPAEHNVGHLYIAKPELRAFYRKLDPCNCFNPGIGHTSKRAAYSD